MAFYIDLRVNDRVIAQAAVRNISDLGDVCDYEGRASTRPFEEHGPRTHEISVRAHDRRQSAWSLAAKIAVDLASREKASVSHSTSMSLDLTTMRRAAEAATQGEWLWEHNWLPLVRHIGTNRFLAKTIFHKGDVPRDEARKNAAHIAMFCPANALALLDALDAANAKLAVKDAEISGIVAMIEAKRDEAKRKRHDASTFWTAWQERADFADEIFAAIKRDKHD